MAFPVVKLFFAKSIAFYARERYFIKLYCIFQRKKYFNSNLLIKNVPEDITITINNIL
jgi:hypothetical protein